MITDRGPEVEAALISIGPMTGEDINGGVLGPRAGHTHPTGE